MKVVYVAGPFRGATAWDVENNIRSAEMAGFYAALAGVVPLIPHTMYRFFNGELTDGFWLEGTMELMRRSDAVLMTGEWRLSEGSMGEYDEAELLNIPVFEDLDSLAKWATLPS